MPDRETVIANITEDIDLLTHDRQPTTNELRIINDLSAAVVLLKEQGAQIKNRDESVEKARAEIKWLRGMLKEQEAIEGTIEETRGEWSDETLPVSRNKEREYSCDHSRRNKA